MSMMHLCELCHFYGGYFAPDSAYLCNAPETSKLMNAPKAFNCGKDNPKKICKCFKGSYVAKFSHYWKEINR